MREGVTAEKDWKIYDPSGMPNSNTTPPIPDPNYLVYCSNTTLTVISLYLHLVYITKPLITRLLSQPQTVDPLL